MGSGPGELRIGLLGSLQLSVDGVPVDVTGRAAGLLAVLALNAGEPVAATRLADRLWGSAQPDDPRRAIQVTVHRLRHRLGAAELVRTEPAENNPATLTPGDPNA